MPGKWRRKTCAICGTRWETRSAKARTCSPKCRAILREQEHPSPGTPKRDYPEEILQQVQALYDSGRTIAEVQAEMSGIKVQLVIERYGIPTRLAIPRDQTGERNGYWRGDEAGYAAFHRRVQAARGTPSRCSGCDTTDPSLRYEWANLTGNYQDVSDYVRLCVFCHRRLDARRRKLGWHTAGGDVNV